MTALTDINRHDTRLHLYADDTQLFASCRSEDIDTTCEDASIKLCSRHSYVVCISPPTAERQPDGGDLVWIAYQLDQNKQP